MEIILHVGMCKTGTTSIQTAILDHENAAVLKNSKYITIPTELDEMFNLGKYFSRSKYWMDYFTACGVEPNSVADAKEKLSEQFKLAGQSEFNAIVSSESLYFLPEEDLLEVKKFFMQLPFEVTIKIVFCVRENISLTASLIQQVIRTDCADLDYVSELVSYKKAISKIINVFGSDNFLLYSYEEAIKDDLVRTFFRKIGLHESVVQTLKSFRVNEASSQLAIEIMTYIKQIDPKVKDGKLNLVRHYYNDTKFLGISGDKFTITSSDAKKIFKENYKDIHWLLENYEIDYSNPDFSKYPQTLQNGLTSEQKQELIEIYSQANYIERKMLFDFLLLKASQEQNNSYRKVIEMLDDDFFNGNKKILSSKYQPVLWGAGMSANIICEFLKRVEIKPQVFIDRDASKVGTSINGISIISPEEFCNHYSKKTDVFVTINSDQIYSEIEKELHENGFFKVHHLA